MTPPAASATARTLPRPAAPRSPRRVSGPAAKPRRGEDARARSGAGTTARGASVRGRAATRRAPVRDPFIVRAIERTARMADSRFLDRLIRGRLWIPLVAAGLMGIVFMQVSMLKLNAGIGRAVQSASTLERQNATMRAQVSGMEAGSKIDETAKSLGMVAPAATTTPSYVKVGGTGQATAAAHRMTPADPEAILRAKQATALATGTTPTTGALGTAAASTTAGAGVVATTQAAPTQTTTATTAPAATGATGAAVQGTATTAGAATTTGATAPTTATTAPTTATTAPPATTGAATTGATATPTPTPTPVATQQPSTSGGAVAPAAG
jgi:hypothetical protein